MALRAHASIHHIETACWVFLLVHRGGENARQYQWRTDFETARPITLGQARELLAGVRVVYGGLRHARPEGREGTAGGVGVTARSRDPWIAAYAKM